MAEKKDAAKPETVPMKLNPLYVETKSKRVNLLLQPTLYKALKTHAADQEISVNELINKTLKKHFNIK